MSYTLQQITQTVDIDYQGKDREISGIHTLSQADETQLSFFNSAKYADQLPHTRAAAVLIEAKYAEYLPDTTIALITDEPYLKLALASKLFAHKIVTKGGHPAMGEGCDIDKRVRFGKNVTLGANVTILAGCYLGDNVVVGSNTILHANVTLYHHSNIGENCIIHSGTVIGSDGYGFAHTKMGEHIKIYQNGDVVIEDDVEIGANCTVDRAVFGSTYIRKGTKLDNLIQIAHNCDVGENTLCAAQSGLAGSATLGRNVTIGGQTAISGHLHVGDFATIGGKSGVTKSLKGRATYVGVPAIDRRLWLRIQAKISTLGKRK
ncbi:MAG: UDP-3-O-(3-hydroxymyristoyl)glucosamine N-acyltransferase [Campylobacterota bacterium]|nr:UDP-3-O-(3-hydroxymyristoyl)glucosamine N-acyltransferase [Campylobacterota bacterium]